MFYKNLLITFFVLFQFISPVKLSALTLKEIEPPRINEYFLSLEYQFRITNSEEINSIPVDKRPTTETLELLRTKINGIESICNSIVVPNNLNKHTQDLNMITGKFKSISDLTDSVKLLESEITRYLSNCRITNEYQSSLNTINQLDVYLNSLTTPLLSNQTSCRIPNLIVYANEFDRYRKNYDVTSRILDNSLNNYNSKVARINEIAEINKKLNTSNEQLGVLSTDLIQKNKLIESKLNTEKQELSINLKSLSNDYQKISNKGSFTFKDVKYDISKKTYNALSIDKRISWYIFEDKKDLLSMFKLIENNKTSVANINIKSTDIYESRESIKALSAQRIAYEGVLEFYSDLINKNSRELILLNQELSSIYQKLDLYKNYSLDLRDKDRLLRGNISTHANNIENCSKDTMSNLEFIINSYNHLPDDLKKEVETQYKLKNATKDWVSTLNASATLSSDPAKLVYILNSVNNIFPRFINCTENDVIDTKIITEEMRRVNTVGFSGFSVKDDNSEQINVVFEEIENEFTTRNNLVLPPVQNYIRFIEQSLPTKLGQLDIVVNTPNFTVTPVGVWSQSLITNKNTYKTYQCKSKNWQEINLYSNYSLEYGDCKNMNQSTTEIKENKTNLKTSDLIINTIKQSISTNNIKFMGQCQ